MGRPPEPLSVRVTPSYQSLSVRWSQQDPLPDTTPVDEYYVVLSSLSRFSLNEILDGRYRSVLDWDIQSWEESAPLPVPPNTALFLEGVRDVREFDASFSWEWDYFSSSAPSSVRLRNGHHYVVVLYSENAAGESRKFVASGVPCGSDDENCWPPRVGRPVPLVCAG